MENNPEVYAFKIPLNQLKKLQSDPQFILILRLGRYMNQLSFCHGAYLQWSNDDTPAGTRQAHNAFFFSSGVLYEAVKILPQLGKEFPKYNTIKTKLTNLSRDKDLNFLKQKVLNKMRNGIIFHVDEKPFIDTLEILKIRRLDLITTSGTKQGDIYFQLSDDVAVNYIVGKQDSEELAIQHYREILEKIVNISVRFITFSNELVDEYIQRKLWKPEIRKRKN